MKNDRIQDEKKLERVTGGSVFPSVTVDGVYRIQCPFCNTVVTGSTREECRKNYEIHSRICYTVVV